MSTSHDLIKDLAAAREHLDTLSLVNAYGMEPEDRAKLDLEYAKAQERFRLAFLAVNDAAAKSVAEERKGNYHDL